MKKTKPLPTLTEITSTFGASLLAEAQERQHKFLQDSVVGLVQQSLNTIAAVEQRMELDRRRIELYRQRIEHINRGEFRIDNSVHGIKIIYTTDALNDTSLG